VVSGPPEDGQSGAGQGPASRRP